MLKGEATSVPGEVEHSAEGGLHGEHADDGAGLSGQAGEGEARAL